MRIITDENIPHKIIKILKKRGWDISTAPRSTDDSDIGKIAQSERRIILTIDKDFTNAVTFPPSNFHGIIRIRIHPPFAPAILESLDKLFEQYSPEDIDGTLVILERNGFRIFS